MTTLPENNLFGFFASFNGIADEQEKIQIEQVKNYLWGSLGLQKRLESIKWYDYGEDVHLILFQIYPNPILLMRNALRDTGSYRRNEKSIGVPIILDNDNFFKLNESERLNFLKRAILDKLDLLNEKILRNKLDLNIQTVKDRISSLL